MPQSDPLKARIIVLKENIDLGSAFLGLID